MLKFTDSACFAKGVASVRTSASAPAFFLAIDPYYLIFCFDCLDSVLDGGS